MENRGNEVPQEIYKSLGTAEIVKSVETMEQQEMDSFVDAERTEMEAAEQREMDAEVKLGYSSSYYEHEMARALEKGNEIAYKNAKKNWANAKVKENT